MSADKPLPESDELSRLQQVSRYAFILIGFTSIALATWRPFWLQTDQFVNTPFVYAVVGFLWIPAIIIVRVVPRIRFRMKGLMIGIVIFLIVASLFTAGFNLFQGELLSFAGGWNCREQPPADTAATGWKRWTCIGAALMDTAVVFIFEGYDGSPIVNFVGVTDCSYDECSQY